MGRDKPIGLLRPPKRMVRERRTILGETMNTPSHKKGGAEAEEICQSGEESVPSESGQRLVDHARKEIEEDLLAQESEPAEGEHAVFTAIEVATKPVEAAQEDQECDIEAILEEVGELLKEDTLETDLKAYRLLKKAKVQAAQRYEDIRTNPDLKEGHNFLEVSPKLVNSFARHTLKSVDIDDKSLIYVMGSGSFNDDFNFVRNSRARVVGVDNSKTAIVTAREYINVMDKKCALEWIEDSMKGIAKDHGQSFDKTREILLAMAEQNTCIAKKVRERKGIGPEEYRNRVAEAVGLMNSARDRIQFEHSNYLKVLRSSSGMGINVIFSNSSFHYFPPHILREIIFPMVAAALRDKKGNVTGKFCLAMKIASSASAKAKITSSHSDEEEERHERLDANSPYNPSYDKVDKVFRIYPETKKDVIALVEQYFDIEYIKVEEVSDYDKTGDTEQMCQLILVPKKEPPTADEITKLEELSMILDKAA